MTAEIALANDREVAVVRVEATGVAAASGMVAAWVNVEAAAVVEVQVMVALPGVTLPEDPGLVKSGVMSVEMGA